MSELLKSAIVLLCMNSVDKVECGSFFGNCVADYKTDEVAFNACKEKWQKYSEKIQTSTTRTE